MKTAMRRTTDRSMGVLLLVPLAVLLLCPHAFAALLGYGDRKHDWWPDYPDVTVDCMSVSYNATTHALRATGWIMQLAVLVDAKTGHVLADPFVGTPVGRPYNYPDNNGDGLIDGWHGPGFEFDYDPGDGMRTYRIKQLQVADAPGSPIPGSLQINLTVDNSGVATEGSLSVTGYTTEDIGLAGTGKLLAGSLVPYKYGYTDPPLSGSQLRFEFLFLEETDSDLYPLFSPWDPGVILFRNNTTWTTGFTQDFSMSGFMGDVFPIPLPGALWLCAPGVLLLFRLRKTIGG